MFPRQRSQRNVFEPFSAHDPDGQRCQKLNVFVNVSLTDPLAFAVGDKDSIRYFESPYLGHSGIGIFNVLQDRTAVRSVFVRIAGKTPRDGLRTHRGRIRPLNAMTLMQKLTGNRLSQAEFAAFTEFDHPPNRPAAILPIKAAVVCKAG